MAQIEGEGAVHSAIEADIARLSTEIKERSAREFGAPPKEALKQALYPAIYQAAPATSAPTNQEPSSPYLPEYVNQAPQEARLQVERLVDLAFHKGVSEAAAQARLMGSFVTDAFHDALVEKLYDEMQARNLL